MSIGDEKYVSLTTYKRDGTPVPTPVWIVTVQDGRVGFGTSSTSGKVKRIKNNGKVLLQPSNARGVVKPGSTPVEGTATVETAAMHDEVTMLVKKKYGFMVGITKFLGKVGALVKRKKQPYADVAVLITLS